MKAKLFSKSYYNVTKKRYQQFLLKSFKFIKSKDNIFFNIAVSRGKEGGVAYNNENKGFNTPPIRHQNTKISLKKV